MKINLNNLLKEQEKSQYWLAKKTGITPATLNKLCSNKTTSITFSTLEAICHALSCTPNDIFILSENNEDDKKQIKQILSKNNINLDEPKLEKMSL